MAKFSYTGQYDIPEYNVRGDSANGKTGSQTPQAIRNQNSQSPQGKGNPYAELLNYLPQKQSSIGPQLDTKGPSVDPNLPITPGNKSPYTTPAPVTPAIPGAPAPAPAPVAPAPVTPAAPAANPSPIAGAPGTTSPQPAPNPSPIAGAAPTNGTPTPQNPDPAHIAPEVWQQAVHWSSFPGYEWLTQSPENLNLVKAYTNDAMKLSGQGQTNIVFADWLHSVDPTGQKYHNPDYMKSAGYDTWKFQSAEDATAGITRDMRAGITPMPADPNAPAAPPAGTPPPGSQRPGGSLGLEWDKTHPQAPPPVGGPPAAPPPNTQHPVNPGAVGGQIGGNMIPPVLGPDGKPVTPAAPPPPVLGTPPVTPPTTPAGQPPGSQSDIVTALRGLLAPQFGYETDQLNRTLRAQGALTGDINSGGFGETMGRADAQLSANQGSRMSDYVAKADQAKLDRALQYHQIDVNQAIAEMGNETTRLGITTNDALQRWLQDPNNNTLNKYQIDKNDLMERYKAELQKEGIIFSAQAQLNAAALSRAEAASARAAQIAADRSHDAIMLQLGLGQQGIDQQHNQDQYNLGLGNLGMQQYQWDNASMQQLLQLYASLSPEQLASAAANGVQFPNWLYTQPGQPAQGGH